MEGQQMTGGATQRVSRVWILYLVVGTVAVAIYSQLPWGVPGAAMYDLLGISAGIAMVLGQRRANNGTRRACVVVGLGLFLFSAGDATWNVYDFVFHSYPQGSIADVFYMSGYVFIAWGILRLVRLRTRGGDRDALIDAVILAIGMGVLAIDLFVLPNLDNPGTSVFGKITAAAYPLADILLVGALARLAFLRCARVPAFWLLLASVGTMLLADEIFAVYGQMGLTGPKWIYLLWIASYVLFGTAALHPSMARLADPMDPSESGPGLVNLVMLMAGVALSISAFLPGGASPAELAGLLAFALIVLIRIAYLGKRADRMWASERRAEAATRRALAAEEASRNKSEFLSRTSHELRTPLNAILGFAQLLEMDGLPEDQHEAVEHILGSGTHLLALVDDLLGISRVQSEEPFAEGGGVSAATVIAESVAMTSAEAVAAGVDMIVEPGGDHHLAADGPRLQQILTNLLSNAVKYNRPAGSVTVSTSGGSGVVRIAISDTGRGLSDEEKESAFAPFDRLGADSLGIAGTGLGLTLARSLVEAMGGTIEVVSAVGIGSTFTVVLPEAPEPSLLIP